MDGAVSITTSTWSASADLLPEACFFAAPRRGVGGAAEVRAEARAEARNDSRGNWIACQRPETIRHLAIPLVSPRAARATRCVGIAASLLGPAIGGGKAADMHQLTTTSVSAVCLTSTPRFGYRPLEVPPRGGEASSWRARVVSLASPPSHAPRGSSRRPRLDGAPRARL